MVKYTLNSKSFLDYGVRVSKSKGIGGMLKRKNPKTFDWAEYHGQSVDLSLPIYEPRVLELDCWIKGGSWQDMINQFDRLIRDEFAKSGVQRLLIEPFGLKPMPYLVYMQDEVRLEKRFNNGVMVGSFTLKLIEPNPIKKVLKVSGAVLSLSYNSDLETEIFYANGAHDIVSGNCQITNKTVSQDSIIVIAGNIEQITNLQTNAMVIWERL